MSHYDDHLRPGAVLVYGCVFESRGAATYDTNGLIRPPSANVPTATVPEVPGAAWRLKYRMAFQSTRKGRIHTVVNLSYELALRISE